jgi:hypothetical protein
MRGALLTWGARLLDSGESDEETLQRLVGDVERDGVFS